MSLSRIFHLRISSRSFIKGGRKPEYPGKNHMTIRKQNMAFPHVTCDPSETRTTGVRNDDILVSVYLKNVHLI